MIIDRNKVNLFKQCKLQMLIEVINAEGQENSNYEDCLRRFTHILSEFKVEGMQMLVFKHKEQDVQQSTLVHKSILTYKPPQSASTDNQNNEEKKSNERPQIPAFLTALAALF